MSDANVFARDLNATVDEIDMVSHANTSSSSSWSASANTNGCFSLQKKRNESDDDRERKYNNMLFVSSKSNRQASNSRAGFYDGLKDRIIDAYESPDKWSAASIDKLSEITKHISKDYKGAALDKFASSRKAYFMPVEDVLAAESGCDRGFSLAKRESVLAGEFLRGSNQLHIFSVFSKGGMVRLDVFSKGLDVAHAPYGQRARVAFVKC